MNAHRSSQILAALLGLSLTPAAFSQSADTTAEPQQQTASGIHIVQPGQVQWKANPALPKGARQAFLLGNPKTSGLVTYKQRYPANYRIPPHWHPQDELVYVLSGDFHIGHGKTFNKQTSTLVKPGGYIGNPAHTPHYVWTNNGARILVVTKAPTGIHYINPKDDPRNKQ